MKKGNILIVCWDFPPHNAIGGRRWAKIAKSLIRMGYDISVITSKPDATGKKLSWIGEAEFSKIKLYTLSSHPLVYWLNDYQSPLRALKIRIAKFLLSFLFKGTVFDRAIGIEKCFRKLVREVIERDRIDTVFVTGAPFNLVYYTARLKTEFPGLKIVADYRDPWINAQNYGMKNLSPAKKKEEEEKQNDVFERVDYITAPNHFLLQEIRETYTGTKSNIARFIELPHAFDPEDVIELKAKRNSAGKIKIVYGGTLYLGIDNYLQRLNQAITHLKRQAGAREVEVLFYTSESDKKTIFSENADCVKFSKLLGDKIFDEIADADFILILLSEHNKNYITSKYYEFLPYKRPYLYVGPEGYVSEKIEKDGFGYSLKRPDQLQAILESNDARKPADLPGSLEPFTFDAATRKLLENIGIHEKINNKPA